MIPTPSVAPGWDAPPPTTQQALDAARVAEHPSCLLCGRDNPLGFKLAFSVEEEGSVGATLTLSHFYQSYPATLHGGVVAALLDAAMTNCLFAAGVVAVTAELTVRYLKPALVDSPAHVTASIEKSCGPLYYVRAELRQHRDLMARASAKFIRKETAR